VAVKKQKSNSLFHLALLTLLVVLLAGFSFFKSQKNPQLGEILPKPFDYKFAYDSGDGNVNIYDLASNSIVSSQIKGSDINWSKDGKVSIVDEKGFLNIINNSGEAKLLTDKIKVRGGYSFWNGEGTGIYVASNYTGSSKISDIAKRAYLVSLDGSVLPIKAKDLDQAAEQLGDNIIEDSSYDGNYQAYTIYSKVHEPKTFIKYIPTNNTYTLPSGVGLRRLSAGNTYLAFKGDGQTDENVGVFIFKMTDITNAKFDSPVHQLGSTNHYIIEYRWIDDSHLLYIQQNSQNPNGKPSTNQYEYKLLDLNSGNSRTLYTYEDNKRELGWIDLYIFPDTKYFATTIRAANISNLDLKNKVLIVNISTGQVIKEIEFASGIWSNPIKD
jgi:hypothetical protein